MRSILENPLVEFYNVIPCVDPYSQLLCQSTGKQSRVLLDLLALKSKQLENKIFVLSVTVLWFYIPELYISILNIKYSIIHTYICTRDIKMLAMMFYIYIYCVTELWKTDLIVTHEWNKNFNICSYSRYTNLL